MRERRRRHRKIRTKTEAIWITGAAVFAVGAVFLYWLFSNAYGGHGFLDPRLTGPIITFPNYAESNPAPPIFIEAAKPAAGQNQKPVAENPGVVREIVYGASWIEAACAGVLAVFMLIISIFVIQLWVQTKRLAESAEARYRESERAFLGVEIEPARDVTGRDGAALYRIEIACANNGKTPTRHGLSHVSWQYFADGGPETIRFEDLWASAAHIPTWTAIAPKGRVDLGVAEIPKEDIFRDTGSVFVWGWVDYNDVFQGTLRHRTEFCFEIERIDRGGQTEIRYRNYHLHNGFDEECYKQPAMYTRPHH